MAPETDENFFNRSDAWVFTALYYSNKNNKNINFKDLFAAGDMLNHSIPTNDEIRNAFVKFQKRGIIKISKEMFEFTDSGKALIEEILKVRGGLFSRIDISLKKLNSKRNGLKFYDNIEKCDFLTDEILNKSYKAYHTMAR